MPLAQLDAELPDWIIVEGHCPSLGTATGVSRVRCRMAGSLHLIDVVVNRQTFTGLYRLNDGVLTLKFAGRELNALTKGSDGATVAERLMLLVLNDMSASRLKWFVR